MSVIFVAGHNVQQASGKSIVCKCCGYTVAVCNGTYIQICIVWLRKYYFERYNAERRRERCIGACSAVLQSQQIYSIKVCLIQQYLHMAYNNKTHKYMYIPTYNLRTNILCMHAYGMYGQHLIAGIKIVKLLIRHVIPPTH